jgi:hypothetical protein
MKVGVCSTTTWYGTPNEVAKFSNTYALTKSDPFWVQRVPLALSLRVANSDDCSGSRRYCACGPSNDESEPSHPPTLSTESRSDLVNYAVSAIAAADGGAVYVARTVIDQGSGWIESVVCTGKAVDHGVFAAGVFSRHDTTTKTAS